MITTLVSLTMLSIGVRQDAMYKIMIPDYVPITGLESSPSYSSSSRIYWVTTNYLFDSREPEGEIKQALKLTFDENVQPRFDNSVFDIIPKNRSLDVYTAFRMPYAQYQLRRRIYTSAFASADPDDVEGIPDQPEVTHIWSRPSGTYKSPRIVQLDARASARVEQVGDFKKVTLSWDLGQPVRPGEKYQVTLTRHLSGEDQISNSSFVTSAENQRSVEAVIKVPSLPSYSFFLAVLNTDGGPTRVSYNYVPVN